MSIPQSQGVGFSVERECLGLLVDDSEGIELFQQSKGTGMADILGPRTQMGVSGEKDWFLA